MIKKIKNKLRSFVDNRVNLIKKQQRLNQQTTFNYNQISQLFTEDTFIPFTAWAISPATILHVLNDIVINKKENVIEFGSGASTFYIAKLLKIMQLKTTFYSVESDKNWVDELRRQLEIYKLENYVTIIYAPLNEVSEFLLYKNQKTWYDEEILKKALIDFSEIDLIVVDGPYGGSTPFARYSAIPFLKTKLSQNCSVYLDDINRLHEQEIVLEWEKSLHLNVKYINRYAVLSNNSGFEVTPYQLESFQI